MNPLRKYVLSPARVETVVLLLVLAMTGAVRASNADSDPSSASNLVTLTTGTTAGTSVYFHLLLQGGYQALPDYVVPAGQNLVITSVEITPFQNGGSIYAATRVQIEGAGNPGYAHWVVTNLVSTEFQYPTGFVLEAGVVPKVFSDMFCFVTLRGYLAPA
jgi:hypothetical protein